jgi:peptide/nickel transport system substrate-binding protein
MRQSEAVSASGENNGMKLRHATFRHALVAAALAFGAAPALAQNLTIATGGSVTSVDPHFFNAGPNHSLAKHFFGTLVSRSPLGRLQPDLAAEWRAVEPTIWEFKLRPNVTWQDGRPFTADDVAFTLSRVPNVPNSPGGFAGFIRTIQRTEVVDPLTIRFHTSAPNPILPVEIASIFIISRHVGEGATTEDYNAGRAVVGTGPYRFVSHRQGDRTEMQRNDAYWGGRQPFQRVSYRFIPNDPARTAALLAGDVDVIDQIASADLPRLRREGRIQVSEIEGLRLVYLMADFSRTGAVPGVTDTNGQPLQQNPFMDVRVRRALNMAIARDAIAERVMEGQATQTAQWLPPGAYSYNPAVRPQPSDLDGARRLLAEAGFPNGFRLVLATPNDRFPNDSRIAQAVAQNWTRIGVQTTVEAHPWATMSARQARQEFGMRLASWGSVTAEASYMLVNVMMTFSREKRTGSANNSRFSSAELDAMTERAVAIMDDAERERALQEIVRWVADNAPIMPIVQLNHTWATRRPLAYQARMDEYTTAMDTRPGN